MGCRTNFDIPQAPITKISNPTTPLPLNWNENPYGPATSAVQAVAEIMTKANRYPDAMVAELKSFIAQKFALQDENVLLTNGSTEILGLVGQQVGLEKGEIVTPWPSFPTLTFFGEQSGATIQKVSLDKNNRIDLDLTLAAITENTKVVFICNPNNPTGTEVDHDSLESFCRAVPKDVLILVDEAYIEYSKNGVAGSVIPLIPTLPNLMVSRTFSKAYGLAGLRLGYALSNKQHIDALKHRYVGAEFATGWPALVAAKATMEDPTFINRCIQKNQEGREIVYRAFDKWGVDYAPSSTNFIYAQSNHFVADVRSKLKEKHILITKWPDMQDHIRISISIPEHMEQFVKVVEGFLV